MISTYTKIPKHQVQEKSSFTATAYFRDLDASVVPTTVRYRIDDVFTGDSLRDWTSLTPAESINIPITPDDNQIVSSTRRSERRQLTIETNTDLDTQTRELVFWAVKRIEQF